MLIKLLVIDKGGLSGELTPSITIQVNGDNEIHFFEAEPTLVMIQSGEQYRYYAIPEEDFRVIQKLTLLAYTYFLYTEDGKNYTIEKPYERINKINPDTGQAIIDLFRKAQVKLP
ncbi:hypothetical protein [Desulfitobacterium hafniense]|uniref:hypothetical protein n=1 Tax=Desulfitobacterium hafniense TaxID=49338 RepID=UPI0003713C08|nr:hypothetical protein [Desulfitobacterium hafniense]